MAAEHVTVEVFPGRFQFLVVAGHDGHVVHFPGGQLPRERQVLLHQRPHDLLRGLRARYVR